MNHRAFLAIFCWIWSLTGAAAQDIPQQFARALEAQNAQQLDSAIRGYEAILAANYSSSELHNNLGIAYLQQKKLGKAVIHFERALLLDAHNSSAQTNLEVANSAIVEPVPAFRGNGFARGWRAVRDSLSANTWAWVIFALLCAFCGGLYGAFWGAYRGRLTLAATLGGVWILALVWGLQRASLEADSGQVVVVSNKILLRQAPELQSPSVLEIHEGTKGAVIDRSNDWLRVRLSDGTVGWLPADLVEKI